MIRKQRDGVYILLRRRSQRLRRVLGELRNCKRVLLFSNLVSSFFCLKRFTVNLSFVKSFYKETFYFKNVNFIKNKFFVILLFPNFVNFGENQYLRNFPLKTHLRKLIPRKKVFRIHLPKLMRDIHLHSYLLDFVIFQ